MRFVKLLMSKKGYAGNVVTMGSRAKLIENTFQRDVNIAVWI